MPDRVILRRVAVRSLFDGGHEISSIHVDHHYNYRLRECAHSTLAQLIHILIHVHMYEKPEHLRDLLSRTLGHGLFISHVP